MPYMVTFTINILQMLVCIPYMDPMGIALYETNEQMAYSDINSAESWAPGRKPSGFMKLSVLVVDVIFPYTRHPNQCGSIFL